MSAAANGPGDASPRARLCACMRRMRTACRELTDAPEVLAADLEDEAALDALLENEERRARTLDALSREFHALLAEWDGAPGAQDPLDAELQALAAELRALLPEAEKRVEAWAALGAERESSARSEAGAVRRGRGLLEKYRPGGDSDAAQMDRRT